MKCLLPASAALAILAANSAFAEDRRLVDAFHCTNVSNDIARLECFDKAYGDFKAAAEAPGEWITESVTNPLDDTVTTMMALNASGDTHPLYGPNQLVIRCQGNELSAWIAWNGFINKDNTTVASRIGSDQAQTESWLKSTSGRSTFYPGNPVEFVQNLMAANRFVAQISPESAWEKTAIFNLNGLKESAELIKDSCLSEAAYLDHLLPEGRR